MSFKAFGGLEGTMDVRKIGEDFFASWMEVMSQPEEFFSRWDPDEGYEKTVLFVVLCGLGAGVVRTVLTLFLGITSLVRFPLLLLFGTVAGGVVLFICFRFLGGRGGVDPTIKMVGYTHAVSVFVLGIPFVGWLALPYQVWLLAVGGRRVHGLDTTKALTAVLVPAGLLILITALMALLGVGIAGLLGWH